MKALHVSLVCASLLVAGDYDFDMGSIEVKPYTLSGYLKGEHKFQGLNDASPLYPTKNKSAMQSFLGEGNLKFAAFKDAFKLDSEVMVNASDIDGEESHEATLAQFFVQHKVNQNHLIEVGKKAPKWGKGYFANPIAFFDRKKDPNDPEASKEGYVMANYRYNKSFEGEVKNVTFDLLFMQSNDTYNSGFNDVEQNHFGAKAYFLAYDTDIELIYYHRSDENDKIGFDFSKNLQTNIEVHGEFAKTLGEDAYTYLLGFKYLTSFDLTITAEYLYQNTQSSKSEPFWDERYLISKFSQKEPLDWLYGSIYYKNTYNLSDNSMQNGVGATYSFKNNMLLDISYTLNDGKSSSEYGSKLVQDTLWTKLYWYF